MTGSDKTAEEYLAMTSAEHVKVAAACLAGPNDIASLLRGVIHAGLAAAKAGRATVGHIGPPSADRRS